jgi:signal peptidase I
MRVVAPIRTAVLSTMAGLVLWSVLPTVLGGRPTLVLTGSMAPAVRAGDIVVVEPVRRPRPGAIVLVADPAVPGRRLLHRLVRIRPDGALVTKGDANPVADSTPVPPGNVLGVVRLRIPAIGLPAVWVHDGDFRRIGALLLLVGSATLGTRTAQRSRGPADVRHRAPGEGGQGWHAGRRRRGARRARRPRSSSVQPASPLSSC